MLKDLKKDFLNVWGCISSGWCTIQGDYRGANYDRDIVDMIKRFKKGFFKCVTGCNSNGDVLKLRIKLNVIVKGLLISCVN